MPRPSRAVCDRGGASHSPLPTCHLQPTSHFFTLFLTTAGHRPTTSLDMPPPSGDPESPSLPRGNPLQRFLALLLVLCLAAPLTLIAGTTETVDYDAVTSIRQEGFRNSH